MKLIALSGDAGNGWHVRDLARAAEALDIELTCCSWRSLTALVGGGSPSVAHAGELAIDQVDAILLRTMPPGTLEQIVFRMDLMHQLQHAGVRVLNPPRCIEISVDKFLASAMLHRASLPTPPTVACQRVSEARAAFTQLGGDVVIKPLFGSEGFGIMRVSDPDLADRSFALLERMGSVIYMQKYIEHQCSDLRLFVLGDQVLAAMERTSCDWRSNIARGGAGTPLTPSAELCQLAIRAAHACQAQVAGVDIILDPQHNPWVLEVNAVPGWRALTQATGIDIALHVLEYLTAGVKQ